MQAPSKAEGKALLANPALLEQELAAAQKVTGKRPAPPPPPPPPPPVPQGSGGTAGGPKTVCVLTELESCSPAVLQPQS